MSRSSSRRRVIAPEQGGLSRPPLFTVGRVDGVDGVEAEGQAEAEAQVMTRAGLAFASSRYCKLEVAWMPQVLDWTIAEYDGLERVTVV